MHCHHRAMGYMLLNSDACTEITKFSKSNEICFDNGERFDPGSVGCGIWYGDIIIMPGEEMEKKAQ